MKSKQLPITALAIIFSIQLISQNVGIGTTTPKNTLDVEGGLSVGSSYSGTNTAPANGAIIQGNTGIGLTNPSHQLTVLSNSNKTLRLVGTGYAGSLSRLNFGDADYVYIDEPVDDKLTIHAAYGVGISIVPTNKFDVNGGMAVGVGYAGTYAAPSNGALFKGAVGIGTTSINSTYNPMLEVNGEIMGTIFRDRNNGDFGLAPSATTTSLYAAGSLYGSQLIDYNNTDYYIDPSFTGISMNVAGRVDATSFYDENDNYYFIDPSNTGMSVRVAGYIEATSFYDKNNSLYYIDPSFTSTSIKVAGDIWSAADIEADDDLIADDDIIAGDRLVAGGNLEVSANGFIDAVLEVGDGSGSDKLYLNHGQTGGFQIINNSNSTYWDLWNQTDGDLALYYGSSIRGEFDSATGAYVPLSDRRLKENIRPLGKILPLLMQLEAKRYFVKDDPKQEDQVGFIAQEVEPLFPELVSKPDLSGERGNYYTMNYSGFGILAVKAIQEQQAVIESQTDRIAILEAELTAIKALLLSTADKN